MNRRLGSLLLLAASAMAPLAAQESAPQAQEPAAEITVAALQARLDAATADTSSPGELKAKLVEVLGRAVESAKATESLRQALQRYIAARTTAPTRLAERTAELQALDGKKAGPPPGERSLADLEQGLLAAQQAQANAQKLATELDREAARRGERRTAIPGERTDLQTRLDAMPAQPVEPADVDPRLPVARRLALQAERARLQIGMDVLTAELQAYDAEVELQRTERDLAARRATAAKADAEAWQAVLQPLRAAQAQQAEREARENVLRADPRVLSLANGNAGLAKAAAVLAEQRDQVEREKTQRDADLRNLQQDFDEVRKRTELVGATDAVGALLRQRRVQLAETTRNNQQRTKSRRDRIADAQLQSLDFDERRRRLVEDPESWLQRELGGAAIAASLPDYVIAEARRLRDARRDLLKQLTEGWSGLLNTLLDVENAETRLGALIVDYRTYVTERVLGIRSSAPVWRTDWRAAGEALAWLGDASQWQDVGRQSFAALVGEGWPLALVVPALLLLGMRFLLQRRLVVHGETASGGRNVAYRPTALAATDTALLAIPLPALVWLSGWRLAAYPECTDFGKAVAAGAIQAAQSLLLVLLLRALVQPKGLAEAHFRWQVTTLAHLRRAVPWLLTALVPFSFLLTVVEHPGEDRWLGSLGGFLLLGQLTLLTIVFSRLLHPRTGIVGGAVTPVPGPLFRFRTLWFLIGVGTPIVLLTMELVGYDYTALQLARRLQTTVAVLLLGVLVHALIVRGMVLQRRVMQMRSAEQRLQATRTGETGGAAAELPPVEPLDPQSLARQTQTLLRGAITIGVLIAAFQIWVDVLPALGILRHVELWTGGSEGLPVVVTLADLLTGICILLVAFAAARNLPALLELMVLQRLRMQPGERHAISTLARYGIVGISIVLAFGSIGVGWSKVQWLVAAVSVGLGFGLQEVFANFVSGLILLFEQPIRVGDIVTVGTTTGRVTRIRIRATTIQDWDRKELIVPNREFVTQQFVNWTLTDTVVRWTIPVGVAYGTDSQKALQLLAQAAAEAKYVLANPAPEAVFTGFGESTLSLQLRVFLPMDQMQGHWLTDLHRAIDQKFRDAGIAMAFPQRDVNLKLPDTVVELLRARDLGAPVR